MTSSEGKHEKVCQLIIAKYQLRLRFAERFPNMVFKVFELLETKLQSGTIILVDDVERFQPDMQDYPDYVRNPSVQRLPVPYDASRKRDGVYHQAVRWY